MYAVLRFIGIAVALGYLIYSSAAGQPYSESAGNETRVDKPRPGEYGVGVHVRGLVMPEWTIKMVNKDWVEVQGMKNIGFGVDVMRRSGIGEVSLGLGYERLGAEDGLWLDDGGALSANGCCPDLVEFDNFAWITADVTVAGHQRLTRTDGLAFRYGVGVGAGIIQGEILRTRYLCPLGRLDLDECHIHPNPRGRVREPKDGVPPVVPLFNVFAGLQARPSSRVVVNVDTGLRWAFYTNVGLVYMLSR